MYYSRPPNSLHQPHPATDFADFFQSKVGKKKIRAEAANAPSPVIIEHHCESLSAFNDVTADKIMRLDGKAPIKHCSLNPAPTWLMKRVGYCRC